MVAPGLNHVVVSAGRLAGEVDLVGVEVRKLNFARMIEPLHVSSRKSGGLSLEHCALRVLRDSRTTKPLIRPCSEIAITFS